MGMGTVRESPEGQDLWLLHQLGARLIPRRPPDEILRDVLQMLEQCMEASSVAYFTVDHERRLRLKLAWPEAALPRALPSEALTQLIINQGRALWVANQHSGG